MTLANAFRLLDFLLIGIGAGFSIATNFIAYQVLRPPKSLGFLWWHIIAITVGLFLWGSVICWHILGNVNTPVTWRTINVFLGAAVIAAAQVIIFMVEKQRYIQVKAMRNAEAAEADDR